VDTGLIVRGLALVAAITCGRVAWMSRGSRRVAAVAGVVVAITIFVGGSVLAVR
jgi:hypothetical protein